MIIHEPIVWRLFVAFYSLDIFSLGSPSRCSIVRKPPNIGGTDME